MSDLKKSKIKGSLIGGAIGDALGYPIEFKRGVKNREVVKYENELGLGIISDDTQMTLFTANALIWRETRANMRGIAMMPVDAIYEAYLDWLDTQKKTDHHQDRQVSWLKNVRELNITRAPGITCLNALSSGKKGTIEQPINDSKGCGGVMRVAPIGLYMSSPQDAGRFAAEASAITHGHPLGIIPAYVFSLTVYFLVRENSDIETSLKKALAQYESEFDIYDQAIKQEFLDLINKAINLSHENMSDIEAIAQLGEGWVAEEALAIAVYSCLKYSNSFTDAVICSVNHDGDSDSTGSIAGNIIGASLGFEAIPQYYIDNVQLKDVILELAEDLAAPVPVNEYNEHNDEKWLSKYWYSNYYPTETKS